MKTASTLIASTAVAISAAFEKGNGSFFPAWESTLRQQAAEKRIRKDVIERALFVVKEVVLKSKKGIDLDFGKTFTESRGVYQRRSVANNCEKTVTGLLLAAELAKLPLKKLLPEDKAIESVAVTETKHDNVAALDSLHHAVTRQNVMS
jgi:hypothetical protein